MLQLETVTMADRQNKRKQSPSDSRGAPYKKSKGGKAGRWKTPFEQARADDKMEMGKILEAGDEGIWVTFARGMKSKAVREFTALCEEVCAYVASGVQIY